MDTKFGSNLSVRKLRDTKPLFMFGQDKYIFKQYSFTKKAWKSNDGSMLLIPKDAGTGVMISTFVSREFVYGLDLKDDDLVKVNKYRRDKQYSDKEAARKKWVMQTRSHLPLHCLFFILNTGHKAKGIGIMMQCQYSLKTVLIASKHYILITKVFVCLTIPVGMIKNTR